MSTMQFELQGQLINGGGLVKTPAQAEEMANSGVDAGLIGSITLEPRPGNNRDGNQTVYHHDRATKITTNALGMDNRGIVDLAESGDLQEMVDIFHQKDKQVGLNIAPTTSEPAEEVVQICKFIRDYKIVGIDFLELNASCPNVPTADGGRKPILSHNPEKLFDTLSALVEVRDGWKMVNGVYARISTFPNQENASEVASSVVNSDADGVVAFNTFPGAKPMKEVWKNGMPVLDPDTGEIKKEPILTMKNNVNGIGGQSGLGMAPRAEAHMQWLVEAREKVCQVNRNYFDIIGSNGIGNGEAMQRRLDMGAIAVSATTIFWEQKAGVATTKLLSERAELQDSYAERL